MIVVKSRKRKSVNFSLRDRCMREKRNTVMLFSSSDDSLSSFTFAMVDFYCRPVSLRKDVLPPENLKRHSAIFYSIALSAEINFAGCVACKTHRVFRLLGLFYARTAAIHINTLAKNFCLILNFLISEEKKMKKNTTLISIYIFKYK